MNAEFEPPAAVLPASSGSASANAAKPGDARFFQRSGPFSVADIALCLCAELAGAAEPDRMISGVAPLQSAGPQDVSFLDNRRYVDLLAATKAGAVILHPELADRVPTDTVAIVTREPYAGWARASGMFFPPNRAQGSVHPSAIIDPSAVIGENVEIGAYAVIGARVEIGAGTIIGPLTVISEGVVIGKSCRIHPQVTISHAIIGDHVLMYPGVRIGQDGFGFAVTKTGFVAVQQLGRVIIGNGVEIGANSCIDRGSAQDTVIGDAVHIDNLVQIAHNVEIGKGAVIVAQVGISGSAIIGEQVMLAGQVGVAGHLHIGKGAKVGGQAGVMTHIPAGTEYVGTPAQPMKSFFREVLTLQKLATAGRKAADRPPSQNDTTD